LNLRNCVSIIDDAVVNRKDPPRDEYVEEVDAMNGKSFLGLQPFQELENHKGTHRGYDRIKNGS